MQSSVGGRSEQNSSEYEGLDVRTSLACSRTEGSSCTELLPLPK